MGQGLKNDKNKLDGSINTIDNILKQLVECENNLNSVMEDLSKNWDDTNFKKDSDEFKKIRKEISVRKSSLKKTLDSTKTISKMIDNYLKI